MSLSLRFTWLCAWAVPPGSGGSNLMGSNPMKPCRETKPSRVIWKRMVGSFLSRAGWGHILRKHGDVTSIIFFSIASIIISPNQRSWDSKHSPFFPLLLTGFDLQTSMHSMGTHPEVFICLASLVPPLRDPVAQNPSPENHRFSVNSFSLQGSYIYQDEGIRYPTSNYNYVLTWKLLFPSYLFDASTYALFYHLEVFLCIGCNDATTSRYISVSTGKK